MFQSFTGNSRRPRQVNLSGRATNPFAAFPGNAPGRPSPRAASPQSAVAFARQERIQRQREREKQNAARVIQRTWRGYRSRRTTYARWRSEWDRNERASIEAMDIDAAESFEGACPGLPPQRPAPYATAEQCRAQLRLLVQFASPRDPGDVFRLEYLVDAFEQTFKSLPTMAAEGEWTNLLLRLAVALLDALRLSSDSSVSVSTIQSLLRGVIFLTSLIPKQMAKVADAYFETMAFLTTKSKVKLTVEKIEEGVLALLKPITSETTSAYEAFATSYLIIPDLQSFLGSLNGFASQINYRMLALAVSTCLAPSYKKSSALKNIQNRTWLLSYLIFFHRYALGAKANIRPPELEFLAVVSELLNSTATYLMQGLEAEDHSDMDTPQAIRPLHPFIKDQLMSLVHQHNVTGLISPIRSSGMISGVPATDSAGGQSDSSREARILAAYALNLLRIFPRRGDDIRMWLFLGSSSSGEQVAGQPHAKVSAIKFFWQASRTSRVFQIISSDLSKVLQQIQVPEDAEGSFNVPKEQRDQEWTTILLFMELYTFVLKLMDDDEFFSGDSSFSSKDSDKGSWTRESALPLAEIKDMTVFLKHLAFTLCWDSVTLSEPALRPTTINLNNYFNSANQNTDSAVLANDRAVVSKTANNCLPGVTGIPLDYFKGLVTGLLRMLHERDSRRKFLPPDHWLMTSHFDMDGFISTVVAEEERRHELEAQDGDDEDADLMEHASNDHSSELAGLAGAGHAQLQIRLESLRRHQQRIAQKRILATIAPRLEILRNMPFFIPFATRVEIFREFIHHDQLRRRDGFVDPDSWRANLVQSHLTGQHHPGHEILSRHQGDIRREHIFDDALDQFYALGDGLKEPIQITFIDQFGVPEAGIDGAVPTIVEQVREEFRARGMKDSDPACVAKVRELLRRYEFLGRVIGKCLYEGILVDAQFVPFFLLKWALTGGTGSALRESSYRANLNDLKDLDAGLYQGLLKLKNYPGNVEEDFGLDFSITDIIPKKDGTSRALTKELIHNGSNIPVTNVNRLLYISCIARYRLQVQQAHQTNAFLQGLGQIIQPAWLSMFNQAELQRLVSGETRDIDVEDLRRNTVYGGVYEIGDDGKEHPTVQLFWQVMHELTCEEKQMVLRFVTSTPRAPLLGFSHLRPPFCIRDSSESEQRLPSSGTCVNLLKLPRYSTAEVLREKLLYAVNSGAGFDLS
ncbi:hypothetical protein N7470_008234 [Penicillium chermesinum]|nr:hypothetical protein N7470_008234 [Penicillium chermesinum]